MALTPEPYIRGSRAYKSSTSTRMVHEPQVRDIHCCFALFLDIFFGALDMADKQSAAPPTLSLYDDLLGASNPNASISAAPVLYKKDGGDGEDVKSKLAKIQQSLNAGQTTR